LKHSIQAIFATLLAWGPWGALILAAVDSAGIPILEGVDALIVFMAAQDPGRGYLAATLAVIGSVAGNYFLYLVGRKGGEEVLDQRTKKGWPKRFRQWFHHYGGLAVFIPIMIPAPLPVKIFVLSAGALGMNRVHFLAIVAVARSLRYFGLAYLGSEMGTAPLEYVKSHAWQLALASAGIFVLLYIAVRIKDYLRIRAHHHHLHPH
jgi:membrane protein DedA with SNARE-associated domain